MVIRCGMERKVTVCNSAGALNTATAHRVSTTSLTASDGNSSLISPQALGAWRSGEKAHHTHKVAPCGLNFVTSHGQPNLTRRNRIFAAQPVKELDHGSR